MSAKSKYVRPAQPGPNDQCLVIATLADGNEIVGVVQELEAPNGERIDHFCVQAEAVPMRLTRIPAAANELRFAIADVQPSDYLAQRPYRQELAGSYADFCRQLSLAYDDFTMLNVVHALETAGFRGIRQENAPEAARVIYATRERFEIYRRSVTVSIAQNELPTYQ